jgi:hypothetical protein
MVLALAYWIAQGALFGASGVASGVSPTTLPPHARSDQIGTKSAVRFFFVSAPRNRESLHRGVREWLARESSGDALTRVRNLAASGSL